jgi:hypothetical protein
MESQAGNVDALTPVSDDELMSPLANVPGAEVWYYDAPNMQIFNGSLTAHRPATKLSRETIEQFVLDGIKREFDEMRSEYRSRKQ